MVIHSSKSSKLKDGVRVCVVIGCTNGDYKLKKWAKSLCSMHNCKYGNCICHPPYELHSFPTNLKKPLQRRKWLQLLNRKADSNKLWSPGKSSRVCSKHFVDGCPTEENPYPTKNLGYDSKRKGGACDEHFCESP